MSLYRLTAVLALLLCTAGCVYKMNIVQGNRIDAESVAQVEPDMSRSQVRFLLGTPIVADPFHEDRWDYVYYFKSGRTGKSVKRHFAVYFDGDVVARVVDAES